ncbi:hypothetical protein PRIPAC_86361 [Pristionchus pacificus]|uniref:Uncharacterized protein n=1 Tax=Pristionchus pacificus TaxID=54126 RepID=A0A2A6BU79_PRIPA|nr:hypothetical protein PRIPAC_86361 [Pristionchus pacificus]|eukprot:PDM69469.1 hypothetical protein PRIPAC_44565 [Pristionchus pacificus]
METIEFTPAQALGFEGMNARQTSDGTIYYVKRECNGADELIYALSNGQTVTTTKSWEGDIDKYDAFGNALFFLTYSQKIYKAIFHPPSEVRVEFVRNVDKLETHQVGMLFSRIVSGRNAVYRAWDHPSKGIPVNFDDEDNNNSDEFEVLALHSNNLIMQIEVEEKLHVKRITPTIIAIDTPNHITSMFASEDSPLIYFLSEKRELTSLNTNTFEHESISLSCMDSDDKDVSFWNIVGSLPNFPRKTSGATKIVLSSSDWAGAIRDADCYRDTLYFRTDRMKIYKVAVSKHPRVEFVRDIKQDEPRYKTMLFSRVYGVAVDADEDVLERYVPGATHSGRIIYKSKSGHEKGGGLMIRALSPNIIAIDSPENFDCDLYTTEESPLIYLLTGKRELTVLNPHSMELISYHMRERWMHPGISHIGKGAIKRKITVVGMDQRGHRLFTAEPPDARLMLLEHDAEKAEKQNSDKMERK